MQAASACLLGLCAQSSYTATELQSHRATQLHSYAATQQHSYTATQRRGSTIIQLRSYAATQLRGYASHLRSFIHVRRYVDTYTHSQTFSCLHRQAHLQDFLVLLISHSTPYDRAAAASGSPSTMLAAMCTEQITTHRDTTDQAEVDCGAEVRNTDRDLILAEAFLPLSPSEHKPLLSLCSAASVSRDRDHCCVTLRRCR